MKPTALLAVLALAAPARAQPGNVTVAQAVANVESFYGRVTTYNATFHQHYVIRVMSTSIDSDGTVTFAKPGRMNWSYFHPPGNRIVVNGQNVWVHQASTNQNVSAHVPVPAALSFLTGAGRLSSSFHFALLPGNPFPGGYVLQGTPVAPTPQMKSVLFWVDAGTSQIRRVTLIDAQRNVNDFTFSGVTVNTAVSPRTFHHP